MNVFLMLFFLLWIFDQQAAYKVLGQLAGVAEILLVKVVIDSRNVGQSLLLGLAEERRCAAQSNAEKYNF